MFNLPEPVSDDELEAVFATALRTGGGQITRATSVEMAAIIAQHLVTWLAVEGIRAVRLPSEGGLTR